MPDTQWRNLDDYQAPVATAAPTPKAASPAPVAATPTPDPSQQWRNLDDYQAPPEQVRFAQHGEPGAGEHISQFIQGMGDSPLVVNHWDQMAKGVSDFVQHPVESIWQGHQEAINNADRAFKAGKTTEGVFHAALSVAPIIGPMIDQGYQEMKDAEARGDTLGVARAAGKTAMLGIFPEMAKRAPEVSEALGKAADAAAKIPKPIVTGTGGLAGVVAGHHAAGWYGAVAGGRLGTEAAEAVYSKIQDVARKRAAVRAAAQAAQDAADDLGNTVKNPPNQPGNPASISLQTALPGATQAAPPTPGGPATAPPGSELPSVPQAPEGWFKSPDDGFYHPMKGADQQWTGEGTPPEPLPFPASRQVSAPAPPAAPFKYPVPGGVNAGGSGPIVAGPITPSDAIKYTPPDIPIEGTPKESSPSESPAPAPTPAPKAVERDTKELDAIAKGQGETSYNSSKRKAEIEHLYDAIHGKPTDELPPPPNAPEYVQKDKYYFLTPAEKAARLQADAEAEAKSQAPPEPAPASEPPAPPAPPAEAPAAPVSAPEPNAATPNAATAAPPAGPVGPRIITEADLANEANTNYGGDLVAARRALGNQGTMVWSDKEVHNNLMGAARDSGLIKGSGDKADTSALKAELARKGLAADSISKLTPNEKLTMWQHIKSGNIGEGNDTTSSNSGGNAGATGEPIQGVPAAQAIPEGSNAAEASPSKVPGQGSPTEILIPGTGASFPANYRVREMNDVISSHNGATFGPNPKYAYSNERDYRNSNNQGKVINGASMLKPAWHITDNPDATNGPPLVTPDGMVLGGNGRTMMLQRVNRYYPGSAAAYKQMLIDKSAQYGLDPQQIAGMKEPILTREIPNEKVLDVQNAINDFNKTGTAALTPAEQAISDSRRVSQSTLDDISKRLDAAGDDATLSDVLKGKAGGEVLNKLIDDGVLTSQQRAAYADEDVLTKSGQERISKLLLGRFFRDPAQLDNVPSIVKNKLERIAAPMAATEEYGEWSLAPRIQQALDLIEEARVRKFSLKNLDNFINQPNFGNRFPYTKDAVDMAKLLQKAPTKLMVDAISHYTEEARHYGQGPGLFQETKDPEVSFKESLDFANKEAETAKKAATEKAAKKQKP